MRTLGFIIYVLPLKRDLRTRGGGCVKGRVGLQYMVEDQQERTYPTVIDSINL